VDAALIAIVGGLLTALIGAAIKLVQMTVSAERRRADDWRTAAQTTAEANKVLTMNVDKLIASVEQLSSSQREMMLLLQRLDHERRASP
jgi:hypothetical protein